MNKIRKPTKLSECFESLNEMLKNSPDIDWFMSADENEVLIESHHGLGAWIRNNWELKEEGELFKYFSNLGLRHPDDMSSVIMLSYHRHIRGKDIGLDEQIKESIDFWRKHSKNNQ